MKCVWVKVQGTGKQPCLRGTIKCLAKVYKMCMVREGGGGGCAVVNQGSSLERLHSKQHLKTIPQLR